MTNEEFLTTAFALAMLLAFSTIVIIYRVEIKKRQVNKDYDKEKAKQQLKILKKTVADLDRQVILGNISKENYQREMAIVESKVSALEKELLDE